MNKILKKNYFEGLYFKQQNDAQTLAFIPALHVDGGKNASASLQIITNKQAFIINFSAREFIRQRKNSFINLGKCEFSAQGCKLDAKSKEINIKGELHFGDFVPPAYDIMGPFAALPFMQCRHSVLSMYHAVTGKVTVNDEIYRFEKGSGYLEGDRGTSFPKRYIWTHCNFEGNSVMLSVADIPLGALKFTGCIGFIFFAGKETRIATYRGVKLLHIGGDCILLKQGKLLLEIQLLKADNLTLYAPQKGAMTRTIHESASCTVRYKCMTNNEVLFDFVSEQASYENNWKAVKRAALLSLQ